MLYSQKFFNHMQHTNSVTWVLKIETAYLKSFIYIFGKSQDDKLIAIRTFDSSLNIILLRLVVPQLLNHAGECIGVY